jgi:hypothetical protein
MSWTKPSIVGNKRNIAVATETYTLPASATTEYSSAIDFVGPNLDNNNRWVAFGFNASAVSGTNLDIGLYVAATEAGTKTLVKDAVVADITATGKATGLVDLNAYPGAFYFLGWTSDTDESANTIAVEVVAAV